VDVLTVERRDERAIDIVDHLVRHVIAAAFELLDRLGPFADAVVMVRHVLQGARAEGPPRRGNPDFPSDRSIFAAISCCF